MPLLVLVHIPLYKFNMYDTSIYMYCTECIVVNIVPEKLLCSFTHLTAIHHVSNNGIEMLNIFTKALYKLVYQQIK